MRTQPEAVDWFAECRKASTYAFILKARLRQLQMENERLHAQRDALLELVVEMDRHERAEGWSEDLRVKIDAAIKAVEGEKK